MFQDFLVKTFPEPQDATKALIVIVLLILILATWVGRKRFGWAATICVVVPVTLLAAVAIPSVLPAKPWAYQYVCINNLKQIQEARSAWIQTNTSTQATNPTLEILFPNESYRLSCPRGGVYSWSPEDIPTCSHSNLGHRLNP